MVRSLFVSTTFLFVMEPSVELPTRDCVVQKHVDQKKIEQRFAWLQLGKLTVSSSSSCGDAVSLAQTRGVDNLL